MTHPVSRADSAERVREKGEDFLKRAVLAGPRDVADGNGCRVLLDNGRGTLGLAIAMEKKRKQSPQLDTVPIRGLNKFAVRTQGWELSPMIALQIEVQRRFIFASLPCPPNQEGSDLGRTQHRMPSTWIRKPIHGITAQLARPASAMKPLTSQ